MQHGHLAHSQKTLVNTHLLLTSRLCVCFNPHVTTTELQEGTFFL